MRLSACMLLSALIGVIGGAWLIGTWCVGLAVIADSVAVGVFALLRDDGAQPKAERLAGVTEEQRFIARVVEEQRSA